MLFPLVLLAKPSAPVSGIYWNAPVNGPTVISKQQIEQLEAQSVHKSWKDNFVFGLFWKANLIGWNLGLEFQNQSLSLGPYVGVYLDLSFLSFAFQGGFSLSQNFYQLDTGIHFEPGLLDYNALEPYSVQKQAYLKMKKNPMMISFPVQLYYFARQDFYWPLGQFEYELRVGGFRQQLQYAHFLQGLVLGLENIFYFQQDVYNTWTMQIQWQGKIQQKYFWDYHQQSYQFSTQFPMTLYSGSFYHLNAQLKGFYGFSLGAHRLTAGLDYLDFMQIAHSLYQRLSRLNQYHFLLGGQISQQIYPFAGLDHFILDNIFISIQCGIAWGGLDIPGKNFPYPSQYQYSFMGGMGIQTLGGPLIVSFGYARLVGFVFSLGGQYAPQ